MLFIVCQLGTKWALMCVVPVPYPHPSELPSTELQLDYEDYVRARESEQVQEAKKKKKRLNAKHYAKNTAIAAEKRQRIAIGE